MNAGAIRRATDAYLETFTGSDAARLRFMQGVWDIQSSVESGAGSYAVPEESVARDALTIGRPLFSVSPPQVQLGAYLEAVDRIAAHCAEHAGLSDEEVEALRATDFSAVIDAESLAGAALSPHAFVDGVVGALEAQLASASASGPGPEPRSVPAPTLATIAFVLMSALTPFLIGPSRSLSELLDGFSQGSSSTRCPVCGSPAALGRMDEGTSLKGAERTLWCTTCHAEWKVERIRCVRCGSRDPAKLRYTNIEGDAAHRLQLCDDCHGYARFVFADYLGREVSMVVEDAATLVLNAVASELGYSANGEVRVEDACGGIVN